MKKKKIGLSKKDKTIIDARIDYYFENNEFTENERTLAGFVMEGGMIEDEKFDILRDYIKSVLQA